MSKGKKSKDVPIITKPVEPPKKTEAELRDIDYEAGLRKAKGIIGLGTLGTINLTKEELAQEQDILRRRRDEANRGPVLAESSSVDIADILKRRREGLGGITAEENQALRSQFKQQLGLSGQTAQRQLAIQQSRLGVRGATAGAQQSALVSQNQMARASAERDLLIKNIEMKQANLNAYEQSTRQAETEISMNKMRNLEYRQAAVNALEGSQGAQVNRRLELAQLNQRARASERYGQLSIAMGYTQLGANERAGQASNAASVAAAQSQGGGGKK